MRKLICLFAAGVMMSGLASCDKGGRTGLDDLTVRDERFMEIADRFVNHTVIPTYTSLSDYTEQLVEDLQALREDVSQANIDKACETFLTARAYWGKVRGLPLGRRYGFRNRPSYRHLASRPCWTQGSPYE